jgi:hypothetical protein
MCNARRRPRRITLRCHRIALRRFTRWRIAVRCFVLRRFALCRFVLRLFALRRRFAPPLQLRCLTRRRTFSRRFVHAAAPSASLPRPPPHRPHCFARRRFVHAADPSASLPRPPRIPLTVSPAAAASPSAASLLFNFILFSKFLI